MPIDRQKCQGCDHFIAYPTVSCKLAICGKQCIFKERFVADDDKKKEILVQSKGAD